MLFRSYFVDMQFPLLLPGPVLRLVRTARLEHATVSLALVTVLGVAALVGLTHLVSRGIRPVLKEARVFWRVAAAVPVVVALGIVVVMRHAGLFETLGRWQVALLVLAAAGAVALVVHPDREIDGLSAMVLLSVIATYAILFARRYPAPRPHAYYLYFDRYLYSEVLPAALVLVAFALHLLAGARLRSGAPAARTAVRVVATGTLVVALLGLA